MSDNDNQGFVTFELDVTDEPFYDFEANDPIEAIMLRGLQNSEIPEWDDDSHTQYVMPDLSPVIDLLLVPVVEGEQLDRIILEQRAAHNHYNDLIVPQDSTIPIYSLDDMNVENQPFVDTPDERTIALRARLDEEYQNNYGGILALGDIEGGTDTMTATGEEQQLLPMVAIDEGTTTRSGFAVDTIDYSKLTVRFVEDNAGSSNRVEEGNIASKTAKKKSKLVVLPNPPHFFPKRLTEKILGKLTMKLQFGQVSFTVDHFEVPKTPSTSLVNYARLYDFNKLDREFIVAQMRANIHNGEYKLDRSLRGANKCLGSYHKFHHPLRTEIPSNIAFLPSTRLEEGMVREPLETQIRIERGLNFTCKVPSGYILESYNTKNFAYEPEFSIVQLVTVIEKGVQKVVPYKRSRKGLCPYCEDIKFLLLKDSSYGNHLATDHGVLTDSYIAPDPFISENKIRGKGKCIICPVCSEDFVVGKSSATCLNKPHYAYLRHFKYDHQKRPKEPGLYSRFKGFSFNITEN